MAESHPKGSYTAVRRSNNSWLTATASLLFTTCLISVAVVLNHPYPVQFSAPAVQVLPDDVEAVQVPERHQGAQAPAHAAPVADPDAGKYRALAEYVARRYRVSRDETANIVALAYNAGQGLKVDPLLILAVISVESRFNPIAESVMGAKGLMQVIPKFHLDKFRPLGGEQAVFDPLANIMVGAQILKNYMRQTGDLMEALRMYVGSSDENDNDYADKVIGERDRFQALLQNYGGRKPAPAVVRAPAQD
jgi:soluble lytic murein transglycosylase-like protein